MRRARLPDPKNGNGHNGSLRIGGVGLRIDWPRWMRVLQRKRRLAARAAASANTPLEYFAVNTLTSFQLEGICLQRDEVAAAILPGGTRRGFRSRTAQRIRNHVAILRKIESSLRAGATLTSQTVLRWYTSISCGLSLASLDESHMLRLDNIVRRINSPRYRLQPALTEIAHVHVQLNIDPLVPSFNGILTRLLLQYHLGRCGLPRIMFNQPVDSTLMKDESKLLKRILEMVDAAYEMVAGREAQTARIIG